MTFRETGQWTVWSPYTILVSRIPGQLLVNFLLIFLMQSRN